MQLSCAGLLLSRAAPGSLFSSMFVVSSLCPHNGAAVKNLQSPIHGGFVFELSACELGGVWSQLPTMPFSMSVSVSIDKPMGGGEFRGQSLACSKVWGSNSAPQSLAGRGPYLRVTYIGCRVAPCIIWAPHCACGFG